MNEESTGRKAALAGINATLDALAAQLENAKLRIAESEKAETARNGNFRPAIRRPTAKVGSKTATSRQNVAAAPKRSANTGCPNKNGFSPLPAHSGDPRGKIPNFVSIIPQK